MNTKVEQLGLDEEAYRLRGQGLGSKKIADALNLLSPDNIDPVTPGNVDNYFKTVMKKAAESKVLTEKVATHLKQNEDEILSRFDKWDAEINDLLEEVKKPIDKLIGVDKKTGEPIIIKEKDRDLLLKVIDSFPKLAESRARLLGKLQTGNTKIFITKIENQYNDLKALVVKAEDRFPGINEWLEEELYTTKKVDASGEAKQI